MLTGLENICKIILHKLKYMFIVVYNSLYAYLFCSYALIQSSTLFDLIFRITTVYELKLLRSFSFYLWIIAKKILRSNCKINPFISTAAFFFLFQSADFHRENEHFTAQCVYILADCMYFCKGFFFFFFFTISAENESGTTKESLYALWSVRFITVNPSTYIFIMILVFFFFLNEIVLQLCIL